jgi:uncharacterized membrane protein
MMNHKIADFIQNLEKLLEGLPQKEIRGALSYYEEYLTDAAEAGENLDEILEKLGSPEEIASVIRAEISIIKAQRSPGLRNFAGATKSAFSRVTTPLAIILLSIFIAISYSAVIILFIGAFATLVAAVLTALGLAAEAFMIPADFKFLPNYEQYIQNIKQYGFSHCFFNSNEIKGNQSGSYFIIQARLS